MVAHPGTEEITIGLLHKVLMYIFLHVYLKLTLEINSRINHR